MKGPRSPERYRRGVPGMGKSKGDALEKKEDFSHSQLAVGLSGGGL